MYVVVSSKDERRAYFHGLSIRKSFIFLTNVFIHRLETEINSHRRIKRHLLSCEGCMVRRKAVPARLVNP